MLLWRARVIDGRPYEKIEDVARVRGISPATLESMRPYLTVVPVATLEPPRVKKSNVHSLTEEKVVRVSSTEAKLPAAKRTAPSETTPAILAEPKVEKLMTQLSAEIAPAEGAAVSAPQAVIPLPGGEPPAPQMAPEMPVQTSASPVESVLPPPFPAVPPVEASGSQVVTVPQGADHPVAGAAAGE